ncbi:MAG TPA: hypothetical protein VHZ26_17625 [Caulobacteraceae bacterium]|jgi:hypothetical protein|nr:hypothetical protein [Caulobacteraceae bacterium]
MANSLRRLIDLPGVDDLEYKALMKPAYARPEGRAEFPEIDAVSMNLFGITADQADEVERPAGWDGIDTQSVPQQVEAFEAAGWDMTDAKRRPLRMFNQFNVQLWLALRGVAGQLPFVPEDDKPEGWVTALERDAARFRKR